MFSRSADDRREAHKASPLGEVPAQQAVGERASEAVIYRNSPSSIRRERVLSCSSRVRDR